MRPVSMLRRLTLLGAALVLAACTEEFTPNFTAPLSTPTPPPTTAPPAPPDFAITCDKSELDLGEASLSTTCSVRPANGFRGTVRLSCAGQPGEVTCAFVPGEIAVTSDATLASALHLSRTIMADPGRRTFQAMAEGGGAMRSADLAVTVSEACAGFFRRPSYSGNCSDGAPHWSCISFSDGYLWHLIPAAAIRGYVTDSCFGMTVETTENAGPVRYRHVLGTNLIATVGSAYR